MAYQIEPLDRLVEQIVPLMPSFEGVFADPETVEEHARRVSRHRALPKHGRRQIVLSAIIADQLGRIFDADERAAIDLGAADGLIAGVVDHQKIMSNPLQLSVPIVAHLDRILGGGDILTFSTSLVGLSEPFNRRAIWIGGQRVNLFPQSRKNELVFAAPQQHFDLVASAGASKCWDLLENREQRALEAMTALIDGIDFGGCDGLSEQMTKINFHLWRRLFAPEIQPTLANLVQLDFERIGIAYLIELLRSDPDAFPIRMLVEPDFRADMLAAFDGLPGAWDRARQLGSQLFWALDNGRRVALFEADGRLAAPGSNGETLDRATIAAMLAERRWIPVQIVLFLAIVYYAGVKPVLGWSLEFTRRLRELLAPVLARHAPGECALIDAIPLDNMNLCSVLKQRGTDGLLEDLSAFDVIAAGGLDREYWRAVGQQELRAFVAPSLARLHGYALSKYGDCAGAPPDPPVIGAEILEAPLDGFLCGERAEPETVIF